MTINKVIKKRSVTSCHSFILFVLSLYPDSDRLKPHQHVKPGTNLKLLNSLQKRRNSVKARYVVRMKI